MGNCTDNEWPIRRGNLLPILEADAEFCNGKAFDFTGWTLTFVMSGPAEVTGPGTGDALGVLAYTWADGDTAVPGRYEAKWEGISPSGKPQTFPTRGAIIVVVEP